MGKKKIANSIIIRVGGGIREVPREIVEITENPGSGHRESGLEQAEDMHPFGADHGGSHKIDTNKIIH